MRTVFEKLKRNAYGLSAFAFLGVAMAPALVATQSVSADKQLTVRSITMSSSTISATGQTYEIKFTTETESNIQAVVVQFCAGSPIIGSNACGLPTGMTVGSTVGTPITGLTAGTWTGAVSGADNNILTISNGSGGLVEDATAVTIPVSGFTNPNEANKTFYARIVTYATTANAGGYSTTSAGTYVDAGGVALVATEAINIAATVQETLTFCVSGGIPTDGCGGNISTPSLTLGTGVPVVLDTEAVYDGTVYYQLSTNAVGVTQVRIKGADAGLRSGSNLIEPLEGADSAAVSMPAGKDSPNKSAFGIRTAAPIAGGSGVLNVAVPYNSTTDYGNNPTNITSTYGDVIASATGALLNKNTPLVFGATAGPTTPAGVYTGAFSLIASSSY